MVPHGHNFRLRACLSLPQASRWTSAFRHLLASTGWCLTVLMLMTTPLRGQPTESVEPREVTEESTQAQVKCPTPEQIEAQFKPLRKIKIELDPPPGDLPIDCSKQLFADPAERFPGGDLRPWAEVEFTWVPTELAHQPLYFDDVPLERYGQSVAPLFQPICSGARFFGTLPVLPYKVALDPPHSLVSTLGYYRPGSPSPCVHQTLPLSARAALAEGGAWVGMIFLLP